MNDKNNKQSFVYKHENKYIVKMDKNWTNEYVSEYEMIDDAEDCAEDWINE